MCGLLGLFKPRGLGDAADAERRLRAGAEALRHRGPDARGVKLLPAAGVGLAHVRLSILDLDPRADQPMASADGAAHIAFNGEIYNFRALRADLAREGVRFRTTGDTEVLLEGYLRWGMERLLERAAGMFAFALYDARRKALFLARDRAGKKPLFFSRSGGGWAFASELRGLLPLLDARPGLDPEGLDAYLSLKFVPSPGTLFSGVKKVRPGHCWTIPADGPAEERPYWTPFRRALWDRARTEGADARLAETDARLTTAVERRLVSDVPVSVFLSGGVDSGLVAAKLGALGQRGLAAYTVGYEDARESNEFEYARATAERVGLDHREVRLTAAQAMDTLRDDALVLDEPVSDWVWVPLHHLSARARSDGFKVVLMGEGADEIFFGYDFMAKGLREARRWAGPGARATARVLSALLGPVYRVSRRGHRRYDLWRRVAAGAPAYLGSAVGFGASQRHQVGGAALLDHPPSDPGGKFIAGLHADYSRGAPSDDRETRLSYVEFYAKMGEMLLARVDRVTMTHSLEARCPFLDQDLVEWAFALPGAVKYEGGRLKAHLKALAERHLPRDVVHRKKMGFSFPFKEWLRGPLAGTVRDSFAGGRIFRDGWVNRGFADALLREHLGGRVDHAPRLWALYSLSRWYDRWAS